MPMHRLRVAVLTLLPDRVSTPGWVRRTPIMPCSSMKRPRINQAASTGARFAVVEEEPDCGDQDGQQHAWPEPLSASALW